MAGTIGNGGIFWNVGDTTGRDDAGVAQPIPVSAADEAKVHTGTDTPTATPTGAPFYIKTPADDLYVWVTNTWVGPYGLSSDFASSTHTHGT
jgi:hypothetical protein